MPTPASSVSVAVSATATERGEGALFETAELGSAVGKELYEAEVPQLRVDLLNAQFDLRQASFPVLVLLVGDDRQGVNETLNLLHTWLDARYLDTHAFGPPTEAELERPRFWRYWRAVPRRGELGIHVGAWAIAAIAERTLERIDEEAFERRMAHACQFERDLASDGTLVLKFWIHLPKKEHGRRLKKARKDPEGARIEKADWRVYERYDEAMRVAERYLRRTHTEWAPWTLVEATDRRHRNLTVARALRTALRARLDADAAATPSAPAAVLPSPSPADVLATVDLSSALAYEEYREKLEELQHRLFHLAIRARRQRRSSVLVFEGWDAAGKGGCIRRITGALDALDYRVLPIAAPSREEKARHYLWRFWRDLPRAGRILLFDRSWYGRVLVERVEGYASVAEWRRAYGEINDFEEQLVEHGIPLLKFWLHVDEEEQLRRFRARARTPYKKYKLTGEDERNRDKREAYTKAVNAMVARTSTELAPWELVAANDKRWARVQVLARVCAALESG